MISGSEVRLWEVTAPFTLAIDSGRTGGVLASKPSRDTVLLAGLGSSESSTQCNKVDILLCLACERGCRDQLRPSSDSDSSSQRSSRHVDDMRYAIQILNHDLARPNRYVREYSLPQPLMTFACPCSRRASSLPLGSHPKVTGENIGLRRGQYRSSPRIERDSSYTGTRKSTAMCWADRKIRLRGSLKMNSDIRVG